MCEVKNSLVRSRGLGMLVSYNRDEGKSLLWEHGKSSPTEHRYLYEAAYELFLRIPTGLNSWFQKPSLQCPTH